MAVRSGAAKIFPVILAAPGAADTQRRSDPVWSQAAAPRSGAGAPRGGRTIQESAPPEVRQWLRGIGGTPARTSEEEEQGPVGKSRAGLLSRRGRRHPSPPQHLPPSVSALLNHGISACQRGRFQAALDIFDAAERAIGPLDPRLLPGLLCNRGMALIHADRLDEAEDVLSWGLLLTERYALGRLRGAITQNLGSLAAARGDTARAMECFDAAAPLLGSGRRHEALLLDRAHALADAGMFREAGLLRRTLGAARGWGAERALTELLSLKLHMSRGETEAASDITRRLRTLFGAGSLWPHLAERIAAPSAGPVPPRAGSAPLRPFSRDAAPSRAPLFSTTTPHLELTVPAQSAALAATRQEAAAALRAGAAATALALVEQARELVSNPHACQDREWAMLLDRYRSAHVRAAAGSASACRELAGLETELAVAQWHPRCRRRPIRARQPTRTEVLDRLAAELGDRAFVCYPELAGAPAALSLVGGRPRLHPLPGPDAVRDTVSVFEHLARLSAVSPGSPAAALLESRAAAVDRMLVEPVAEVIGDREVVIAPGPRTQALPWGLLPGLRERPVSIVPSGSAWLRYRERARRAARRRPRTLLVSGPGLAGAATETGVLVGHYPGSRVLVGERATAREVLRELTRADVAHIGAHGFAPSDIPMCAGLSLVDGPLLAYDLERVRRLPALTVLSSCEAGRSTPAASGLPLGMAAAFLARGGATVIASVLPVADGATADAMVRAHTALRSGASPAAVVAEYLAHSGFGCFGAG